jgi:uncharacterized membrane protein
MIPRQLLNGAIAEEIQNWYSETLISRELRDTLSARYPVVSAKSMIISTLITVGSVMVGLGSLLFIASHWSEISVFGKLALILLSIVATNAAGWWFQFKKGNRPRLGEALFLLGSFFYGSGIWLISQIFNISGDIPQGLLLWSIGTSAVALATGSASLGIMSTALIGIWTMAQTEQIGYLPSLSAIANFILGTAASLAISYRLRSPWSLSSTLIGASFWLIFSSHLDEFGSFIWGIILFNLYLLHRNKWQLMAPPYQFIGVLPVLGSLLAFTFDYSRTFDLSPLTIGLIVSLLAICFATSAFVATANHTLKHVAIGTALVASSSLLIISLPAGASRAIVSNIIFISVTVSLLYVAVRDVRNAWLVNTTMFFLGIYILCRYCDTFFSIMDRSLFFLLGGTLLMIIGAIAERKRREFLEGLRV